jgi:hypothetical protein
MFFVELGYRSKVAGIWKGCYWFKCRRKKYALTFVLYGCEARPVTLREEHRLRVFANRVLRRIFGPKRQEVEGGRRKVFSEVCKDGDTETVTKSFLS